MRMAVPEGGDMLREVWQTERFYLIDMLICTYCRRLFLECIT